jgi:Spy/CpxP family protein refolding chaperone
MRFPRGASTIAAAGFVLAASQAFAQPGSPRWPSPGAGPGAGMPPHGREEGMTRELGLSQEQQDKVREIMDEQRSQRDQLHDKIAANRDALHELLESGSADATAVGELVLKGRRLHEESRALRDAEQKAIRAILTPEQQKKFDKFQSPRRGPGGRPGRGPEGWPAPPPGGGPGSKGQRPPFAPAGQPPLPW